MPKPFQRGLRRQSADRLLDRILATPQLARLVPQLQPEVLHRLIQRCGLEDCGELLALASPGQLTRVFDLDLWRPPAPGLDDRFDADRFGTWLEVMVDAGVPGAAATLAAMDVDLLAAALVQYVRVFDSAAVSPYITLDGEVAPGKPFAEGVRSEIGGYVVLAGRTEFWDAITVVLTALADAHGTVFDRVMRRCCRQSNSRPEIDGLDDLMTANEQAMFDVAVDREARGESHGHVTPAQARAFLHSARRTDVREIVIPARDPVTHAYFRDADARTAASERDATESPQHNRVEPALNAADEAMSAIVDLLHESGVIPRAARRLFEAPQQTNIERLARIRAQLDSVHDRDLDAYAMRNAELAYLANIITEGTTIQSRAVHPEEASEAALAVCNLGLENWPARWTSVDAIPEALLAHHDLVTMFRVGWTVLHEDVCMYAADQLATILRSIRCVDPDLQDAIEILRTKLTRHSRAGAPWEARAALEVIAVFDAPAWAALLGLIDQLPTMHAALTATLCGATHRIDATRFEFISEHAQIQQVRDFMQMLPARLV